MATDTQRAREGSTGVGLQMSRRELLQYFAALVASGSLGKGWPSLASAASPSLPLDDFLALVTRLCGIDASDPDDGKPYWEHFSSAATLPALVRLAAVVKASSGDKLDEALTAAHLDQVANAIVSAFYSGELSGPEGTKLVTYLDALVWQAVESFTKPPSICGGSFGYWADPPSQEPLQQQTQK